MHSWSCASHASARARDESDNMDNNVIINMSSTLTQQFRKTAHAHFSFKLRMQLRPRGRAPRSYIQRVAIWAARLIREMLWLMENRRQV